jgi:hypothetical protein
MSRSNNSRKGAKKGNWQKDFWSKRADSKATGFSGVFGKKLTAKIERQINKPKKDDFE